MSCAREELGLKITITWTHQTYASATVYTNRDGKGEYGPQNNVRVDDESHILKYDKSRKSIDLNGVDIGFFVINKKILELMPSNDCSFEEEVLPRLIEKRQLSGYQTEHRYYYITTPESLKVTEKFLKPRKVVIVDRDGVINKKPFEHDYVKTWDEFEFLPGAIEALKLLTQKGYEIYVATNQAGIARNLMSENDLKVIHNKLQAELYKHGARINRIYYCPHGWDDGCECRKPKPGMLFQAASEQSFNLMKAIFIGDGRSDLQAGNAAGCKTLVVKPGKNLLQIVNGLLRF